MLAKLARLVSLKPSARAADTDTDWNIIGAKEPYYGVIADPKFLHANLTLEAKEEFFLSGAAEIDVHRERLRQMNGKFEPKSALDFGCGVGRLTKRLAEVTGDAVGVDISDGMLSLAREDATADAIYQSMVPDRLFDWVISIIVMQHIPPERGYVIIKDLLARVAQGGALTLHVTFFRDERLLIAPGGRMLRVEANLYPSPRSAPSGIVGDMTMFDYDLSIVLGLIFAAGINNIQCQHTDHGGFHGAIIYGRKL